MKVQEVILRAIDGRLKWYQAAEILGVSGRQMSRWRHWYEQQGYDGLFSPRWQQPSPRRVPLATVREVLTLYRERYPDLSVRQFHEKLRAEHGIPLSYAWVETALQEAGLVTKGVRQDEQAGSSPSPGKGGGHGNAVGRGAVGMGRGFGDSAGGFSPGGGRGRRSRARLGA